MDRWVGVWVGGKSKRLVLTSETSWKLSSCWRNAALSEEEEEEKEEEEASSFLGKRVEREGEEEVSPLILLLLLCCTGGGEGETRSSMSLSISMTSSAFFSLLTALVAVAAEVETMILSGGLEAVWMEGWVGWWVGVDDWEGGLATTQKAHLFTYRRQDNAAARAVGLLLLPQGVGGWVGG